jgi:23S rRNA (uracil1939-C5)-methyltransferase
VLYDLVVKAAEPRGDDTVLDLYSGTGTIGLYLAPHVQSVRCIEQVEEAVGAARTNAVRNGVTNVQFETMDTLVWLKSTGHTASLSASSLLIVLDPPRAGLHPDVPRLVAATGARRIVYVSCNPAAFARDVGLFETHGYLLESAAPIDMFPHTAHVECVAVFVPK